MSLESLNFEKPGPKFTVSNYSGSKEQPTLIFSHNGVHFTYELDLVKNRFREVGNPSFDYDINQNDVNNLRTAVEKAVKKELHTRQENLNNTT